MAEPTHARSGVSRGAQIAGVFRGRSFRVADVVLAALVILAVTLMIVPLPTWILDILISTNLSVSVALLLVVLYVPDAISIATFPTVLLLTTLFRLALNVASTRLILLQANAGEVIKAFGNFVVKGNYVVGAVIFLVLTIIQFVVIAKGSERVAEVGARFTLDAMPGKQMAIDAELRAGSIDGNEAKRRRSQLSRESQFYGAMDGAMKFVKGDVIASVIIAAVNILAGLAIGVLQRGMPAGDALKRYGLLTIGDGLVTEIPSLVLSTAAGVLVTRVASEDAGTPLGEELARQLFGVPKALQVASVFVLGLALIPGLPTLPFVTIGVLMLFYATVVSRRKEIEERRALTQPTKARASAPRSDGKQAYLPLVIPWQVEVSSDLEGLLDDERNTDGTTRLGLRAEVLSLCGHVFTETGVPLPPPRLAVRPTLPERHVTLSLHELPAKVFRFDRMEGLKPGADLIAEVKAGVTKLLVTRAADFLGLAETQRLLDELEQFAPATVRNVVPKPVSLSLLAEVLRRLVEEGISIRDLRAVLEALSAAAVTSSIGAPGGMSKDPVELTDSVRTAMKRWITYWLTRGEGALAVVTIEPMIEETIRRGISRVGGAAYLTLQPAMQREIIAAFHRALATATSAPDAQVVILTQPDVRRFVRGLCAHEFPDARVVTHNELLPDIAIRPVAHVHPAS